jgi:hypothetical protein
MNSNINVGVLRFSWSLHYVTCDTSFRSAPIGEQHTAYCLLLPLRDLYIGPHPHVKHYTRTALILREETMFEENAGVLIYATIWTRTQAELDEKTTRIGQGNRP